MKRRDSKTISVGGIQIGGGAPIRVQSMCNTDTRDVNATLAQIKRLADAGCEIVRLAVPDMEAATALHDIRKGSPVPLVADIHFDWRLALEAVRAGMDKIRINPGNIGDSERVRTVADACTGASIPIRIGVNGGSLDKKLLQKYGSVCPEALVESALEHVALLNQCDFDDICISIKVSNVQKTIEAYRLLAEKTAYPLHLGVTETGTAQMGSIKSAIGIGSLLCDGIGDTIRVSLTADPVEEVLSAQQILHACGLSTETPELISCPTCGRCRIELIRIAGEVEARLKEIRAPLKVAVMGCAVNGPGEAREADVGMAGGNGDGLLFRKGEIVKKVPMDSIVEELIKLAKEVAEDMEWSRKNV
ncbi:MAG: flavodoxin-dependent (E)-4-hydroxy-3-methylbut-2-enyl-diphosphate synthase [Ruminococcaceae bacterium]|nr:flavodoxin-dependent (E)-4-hydroxy-3-methylbut-2-enyl-diphosphate synthase [Oscillospiraceae bacterium]